MKYLINRIKLCGVKNIDKPIDLLFTNKTIENIKLNESNVKAIYGPNGSGKTGIISAIYIYKHLITDTSGLNDIYFANFVKNCVNKKTNKIDLEICFLVENGNNTSCFKHCLSVGFLNEDIKILQEELFICNGKTIDDGKKVVEIENGEMKYLLTSANKKINDEIIFLKSLNTLDKHSIVHVVNKLLEENNLNEIGHIEVFITLLFSFFFARNMVVLLNEEDMHTNYIINDINKDKLMKIDNKKYSKLISGLSKERIITSLSIHNKDVILKKTFAEYKEKIDKLSEFISIFIPSLKRIDIEAKEDNDKLYCEKKFVYNDYSVDVEFESTGIKKLVKLYSALNACANGGVAFIDEMDANLHDVYFEKLIEFFKEDGKGQLCLTTHNLEPIEILKDSIHSLDFLSNDSRIYSWKKDGNKSPLKAYKNGLIDYSPFNVNSFDFDVLIDEVN